MLRLSCSGGVASDGIVCACVYVCVCVLVCVWWRVGGDTQHLRCGIAATLLFLKYQLQYKIEYILPFIIG